MDSGQGVSFAPCLAPAADSADADQIGEAKGSRRCLALKAGIGSGRSCPQGTACVSRPQPPAASSLARPFSFPVLQMRILHVGQHHELVGGAEVLRERLIEGLSERGHACAFFGGSERRSLREDDRWVVRRPEYDGELLVRDPRLERELGRFLERFRPDVVHLHQVSGLPLELYGQLGETGLPLVETVYDYGHFCPNSWSVHGDGSPCESGPGSACFEHGCHRNYPFHAGTVWNAAARLRTARAMVDVAISPTHDLQRRLGEQGFPEVRRLPYFPLRKGLAPLPLEQRTPDGVLVVARLEREKGVAQALEAFAVLQRRRPGARLTIVGDGSRLQDLERRSRRLGIAQSVRFRGSLPLEQTLEELRRARVLAIPSIWMEALPLVTFDADALGLPMVANPIGGLPEAIDHGENGFLANAREPSDFAAAIGRLLTDDELWRRMAANGPARHAQQTEADYLDGLEAAYATARTRAGLRGRTSQMPFDDEERALLDAVTRHCGALEKEIFALQHGVDAHLVWLRQLMRATARKARTLFARRRPQPARPAAPAKPTHGPDEGRREAV